MPRISPRTSLSSRKSSEGKWAHPSLPYVAWAALSWYTPRQQALFLFGGYIVTELVLLCKA